MSKKVNRSGIARALGVSLPTVDAWVGQGMPVKRTGSRGKSYSFDVDECLLWASMRQTSGPARADLADGFLMERDGPLPTFTADRICEMLGWSKDDLREAMGWGCPWLPGEGGPHFSSGHVFRWTGLMWSVLNNNGVRFDDFRRFCSTLRALRLRAGKELVVRTEVRTPAETLEHLATLDGETA